MKIGDKVYVGRTGSWYTYYYLGTVTSITPKGMVDVKIGASETPTRFNPNGHERGADRYHSYFLDPIPFEKREAVLAQIGRTRIAVGLLHKVEVNQQSNDRWGKEGLLAEVERLQELLTAAKVAVDAI